MQVLSWTPPQLQIFTAHLEDLCDNIPLITLTIILSIFKTPDHLYFKRAQTAGHQRTKVVQVLELCLSSIQLPVSSPSTAVPELSCSLPSLAHGWHWQPCSESSPSSSLPAVSQYSPACTTCTLSWKHNSWAPACCLQRKRLLSWDSVQFKITKMLLPPCLSKLLLFLFTGNTLPNNISFIPCTVLQLVLHITCCHRPCHHEPCLCMKPKPSSRRYLETK